MKEDRKIEGKIEGAVKWFNKEKGFGFVTMEEEEKDIFVHFSEINGENQILVEGEKVTFDLHENEKGLIAKNVSQASKKFTSADDLPPTIRKVVADFMEQDGFSLSGYLLAEKNFYAIAATERLAKILENSEMEKELDDLGGAITDVIKKLVEVGGATTVGQTTK